MMFNSRKNDRRVKGHVGGVIVAMSVFSLSVVGCSSLPKDSSPQVLRSYAPAPVDTPDVGPRPGMEPDLLLRDFYSASAIPAGEYAAARSFLDESTASRWNPESPTLLLDQIDLTTVPENADHGRRTFDVQGAVIGKISEGGIYTSENGVYEAQVDMEKVDGEWRIVSVPEGVAIERTELRNQYRPQTLYFYGQQGRTLVSERRWLYDGTDSLDVELITLLMQGPSENLAPATSTVAPAGAAFAGIENGEYRFGGMSDMDPDARLRFAAQLVWTLSKASIPGPYVITADGAPLVEGLEQMTTDDFADFNPETSTSMLSTLYALNGGKVQRVEGDSAEPVEGLLGSDGTVQSLEVDGSGRYAAVREDPEDSQKSQLVMGSMGEDFDESHTASTISRPTFEPETGAAWAVLNGKKIIRAVRSSTSGSIAETEVKLEGKTETKGEISVLRLSATGARAAMIIGGKVFVGVVSRETDGTYRITNVRELGSELGGNVLALDWQADGSLVVGTSMAESPIWRLEQDGSAVTTLPAGNLTAPIVAVETSMSTIYVTDSRAILQISADEPSASFWREVPGLQGKRSAPIVAN